MIIKLTLLVIILIIFLYFYIFYKLIVGKKTDKYEIIYFIMFNLLVFVSILIKYYNND